MAETYYSTGRRKSSTARVYITAGEGSHKMAVENKKWFLISILPYIDHQNLLDTIECSLKAWRKVVGFVPQEVFLLVAFLDINTYLVLLISF